MITRDLFVALVGREPTDDDLERCNCRFAGRPGHYYCGWFECCNNPKFLSHKITCKEAGYGSQR